VTIRKGVEWGEPVARPSGLVDAASDAQVASLAASAMGPPFRATDGDIARSLGGVGEQAVMQRLPMDLLRVTIDGDEHVAAAHVIARRAWWHGPIIAAMNVDHLGEWNVAPRAHPNDGRFDVIEVDARMRLRHRLQARRRLPQGTHHPHPQIGVTTATSRSWRFDRRMHIHIDGVDVGECRDLIVTIEPDAYHLLV
jgi:diacylglycerol kinase family enzyme